MAKGDRIQLATMNDINKVKEIANNALPISDFNKENLLTELGTLPVENGGTGATTKKEAFANLAYLGNNPISSTEEDTPQKWLELGSGYAKFNE